MGDEKLLVENNSNTCFMSKTLNHNTHKKCSKTVQALFLQKQKNEVVQIFSYRQCFLLEHVVCIMSTQK